LGWSSSPGATSYTVLSSTTSGAETTLHTGVTGTGYTDTTAVNGTIVYYAVEAVNGAGAGPNSTEVSAAMPPGTPTGLSATPGINQATLTWTAPTGASGATSYIVKRSTTSGAETTLAAGVTGTNYTDATAANGTIVYYEVSAVNASGTGLNSTEASATMPPGTPTGLSATPGINQVALTWTAPSGASGATSYNVKRSTTSGAETTLVTGVTATAYTDATAAAGNTYYYEVSAVNASGQGVNSAEAGAIMVPATPAGVAQSPGNNQAALSWSAASGATSYNVMRSIISDSGYVTLTTAGAQTTTSYTDGTAVNGTIYYYVIQAANVTGNSGNSSQVTSEPLAAATGLGATAGTNQVVLTWTTATGATSYTVLRSATSGAEPRLSPG